MDLGEGSTSSAEVERLRVLRHRLEESSVKMSRRRSGDTPVRTIGRRGKEVDREKENLSPTPVAPRFSFDAVRERVHSLERKLGAKKERHVKENAKRRLSAESVRYGGAVSVPRAETAYHSGADLEPENSRLKQRVRELESVIRTMDMKVEERIGDAQRIAEEKLDEVCRRKDSQIDALRKEVSRLEQMCEHTSRLLEEKDTEVDMLRGGTVEVEYEVKDVIRQLEQTETNFRAREEELVRDFEAEKAQLESDLKEKNRLLVEQSAMAARLGREVDELKASNQHETDDNRKMSDELTNTKNSYNKVKKDLEQANRKVWALESECGVLKEDVSTLRTQLERATSDRDTVAKDRIRLKEDNLARAREIEALQKQIVDEKEYAAQQIREAEKTVAEAHKEATAALEREQKHRDIVSRLEAGAYEAKTQHASELAGMKEALDEADRKFSKAARDYDARCFELEKVARDAETEHAAITQRCQILEGSLNESRSEYNHKLKSLREDYAAESERWASERKALMEQLSGVKKDKERSLSTVRKERDDCMAMLNQKESAADEAIEALQVRLRDVTNNLTAMRNKHEAALDARVAAEAEIDAVQDQLNETLEENKRLRRELDEVSKERDSAKSYDSAAEERRTAANTLKQMMEEKEAEVVMLRDRQKELMESLAAAKEESEEKAGRHNVAVSQLNQGLEALKGEYTQKIDKQKAEIAGLQEKLDESRDEIKRAQDEMTKVCQQQEKDLAEALGNQNAKQDGVVMARDSEIHLLRAQLEGERLAHEEALKREQHKCEFKVKKLEAQLNPKKLDAAEATQPPSGSGESMAEIRASITRLLIERKTADGAGGIEPLTEHMARLKQHGSERKEHILMDRVAELEAKNRTLGDEVERYIEQNFRMKNQIEVLQAELDGACRSAEGAATNSEDVHSVLASTRKELDTARMELGAAQVEIGLLRERLKRYTDDVPGAVEAPGSPPNIVRAAKAAAAKSLQGRDAETCWIHGEKKDGVCRMCTSQMDRLLQDVESYESQGQSPKRREWLREMDNVASSMKLHDVDIDQMVVEARIEQGLDVSSHDVVKIASDYKNMRQVAHSHVPSSPRSERHARWSTDAMEATELRGRVKGLEAALDQSEKMLEATQQELNLLRHNLPAMSAEREAAECEKISQVAAREKEENGRLNLKISEVESTSKSLIRYLKALGGAMGVDMSMLHVHNVGEMTSLLDSCSQKLRQLIKDSGHPNLQSPGTKARSGQQVRFLKQALEEVTLERDAEQEMITMLEEARNDDKKEMARLKRALDALQSTKRETRPAASSSDDPSPTVSVHARLPIEREEPIPPCAVCMKRRGYGRWRLARVESRLRETTEERDSLQAKLGAKDKEMEELAAVFKEKFREAMRQFVQQSRRVQTVS